MDTDDESNNTSDFNSDDEKDLAAATSTQFNWTYGIENISDIISELTMVYHPNAIEQVHKPNFPVIVTFSLPLPHLQCIIKDP